jgi:SAM-dependent methyltransferase
MISATLRHHPTYGLALPESGWVPAPSYLLRRDRVLRLLRSLPQGRILEIGCGVGALIDDLVRLGHRCAAIESSPAARALASELHKKKRDVRVHADGAALQGEKFDYVVALEVLEHIEEDREALLQWARWTKAEGYLLISVPAHRRRWSASDVWAGHFRRYEKDQILGVLRDTGFEPVTIECYGFPLANAIEPARALLHGRALKHQNQSDSSAPDQMQNTHRSGTERTFESRLYPLQSSVLGTWIMRLCFVLQNLFVGTELGTGFLVLARKQPATAPAAQGRPER